MTKDALKRLLKEAHESPPGTTSLQGEEGLTATLEESTVGEARWVRVFHGQQEIHNVFLVQADEEKPHFFPDDLPFIPDAFCSVMWTEKGGLVVFWIPPSSPESMKIMKELATRLEGLEVPSEVEEFLSKAKTAGKETAKGLGEMFKDAIPASFMEKAREATKGLFGEGLSEEASKIAEGVSAFLEEDGWLGEEVSGDPGHFYTRSFSKGESQRKMRAISMFYVSGVVLSQK